MNASEYVDLLRRRWIAILLCLVAGVGGAVLHTSGTTKVYLATSRTIVTFSLPENASVAQQQQASSLTSQLMATYAEVATSRQVAQNVIDATGLQLSADALKSRVVAGSEKGTFVLGITVKDTSPSRAALVADAYADALSKEVKDIQKDTAKTISISLLDKAKVPSKPSSPKPVTDLIFGLVLGLLAGLGGALLLEALDRSIKTRAQGSHAFGAPVLGIVPRRRGSFPLLTKIDGRGNEAEFFRSIRTAVNFLDPDEPLKSILITSAVEADGKTTVSANLALTFASSGHRVVVVDADLRRAKLSSYMGVPSANGLSSVLVRMTALDEAVVNHSTGLDILPAGATPPNPAELLSSHSMAQLIEHLGNYYDIVIIDAPPVLSVTDSVALSALVDGVITVARFGRTRRTGAHEAARRIHAVGGRIVGFVLNAVPLRDARGYGGYGSYGSY